VIGDRSHQREHRLTTKLGQLRTDRLEVGTIGREQLLMGLARLIHLRVPFAATRAVAAEPGGLESLNGIFAYCAARPRCGLKPGWRVMVSDANPSQR
jgi:hypothetical protein